MIARIAVAVLLLLAICAGLVAALNFRGEAPIPDDPVPFASTSRQIARGEYLARAGNCIGCHTARGGAIYAGGLAVRTPFGIVYSSNLTPDAKTGLGTWSASHFFRAMHNGRSKDGRLLYPAFPYPSYTQITREDSDAIYAYLRTLAPVEKPQTAHRLRFPYNSQAALAVWRALFFAPAAFEADPERTPEWNRGAYLVRGLGHCVACHSPRNAFGATSGELELSGGLIPMQGWYAPSLASAREAGVAQWDTQHVVALLKTGVSPRGSVMGPMAEVVFRSTQHLSESDLHAMAVFLQSLPEARDTAAQNVTRPPADDPLTRRGAKLYESECAQCHGDEGEGAQGAYPALAGNRAVTMEVPANVIRAVLSGGFLPATAGNPRPYGMPPYSHVMSDADIAAVVTYIRGAWGNAAAPVTQLEVMQYKAQRSD